MSWVDKSIAYEDKWNAGTVAQDIWKYIPESKKAFVTDAIADSEGYWIWLDEDHVAYDGGEDCGTIHEYTIADLRNAIKTIRKASPEVTAHRLKA